MLGKKNLVFAALVITLGTAIFISTMANKDQKTADTSTELGKAQYVNASFTQKSDNVSASSSDAPKDTSSSKAANGDEEKTVETVKLTEEAEKYFAQARLDRQKAQDEITELAKDVLELSTSTDEAKTKAVANVAEIANIIEQQSNIESLIKAKGFTECMAFIQNGECSIVINKGALTEASAIAIKDIVKGQSGIAFDKIKIVEI